MKAQLMKILVMLLKTLWIATTILDLLIPQIQYIAVQ